MRRTRRKGRTPPGNDLAKRKIIKKASLRGETLSFDEFMTGLDASVVSYGAYIESSRTGTYRAGTKGSDLQNATVVVRVPADRYDAFMKNVGTLCNILDSEEAVDDVTLEYVDVESRIKAYRAEEASLLAMLERAKTVSELITVEERLSQVRYEIESCQSRLNALSDMISYSTVTLNIYEVENETVTEYPSVFGEIKNQIFQKSFGCDEGIAQRLRFRRFRHSVFSSLPCDPLHRRYGSGSRKPQGKEEKEKNVFCYREFPAGSPAGRGAGLRKIIPKCSREGFLERKGTIL